MGTARGRPWRSGEFRALICAQVTSEVGDQFARVAVAGVVLDRSGSTLYSALAFVVSYLPGIGGALLLGPLADRLPRRGVLMAADVLRAAVIVALALAVAGHGPLWSLMALLLLAELFSAPFDAARAALLPDVLPDAADYLAGAGISRVLYQVSQTIGFAAAGVVVYGGSAELALWIDAATYGASALVLVAGVRPRPAALTGGQGPAGIASDVAHAAGLVFADPVRRLLVLLGWASAAVLIAPEGVALAYAVDHGDPRLGGALIAALPAGAALGAWALSRHPPEVAVRAIRPLLLAGCVPLLLTGLDLGVYPTIGLWFLAGICQAFLLPVIVLVTLVTAPERRGAVNGLAAAGFNASVALAFVLAGWAADVLGPAEAVCGAGALGLAVLTVAHLRWPSAAFEDVLGEEDTQQYR